MYKRRNNSDIKFIGVDWGSSNFRAYAVDTEGNVRQRTKAHQGVSRICDGNFSGTLKRLLGKWFNKYPDTPLVMLGTIGARQGWQEVECAEGPTNSKFLADFVEKIHNHRFKCEIHVVPGVRLWHENRVSMDQMRGEEVQILGALKQLPEEETQYVCCPGSHPKWVKVHNQTICQLKTFMTGELYNLLSRNGVLSRMMESNITDFDAFAQGLKLVQKSDAILADLYSVYNESLLENIVQTALPSYLSGILIGSEIKQAKTIYPEMTKVIFVGAPWLMDMYQAAAHLFGLSSDSVKSDVATVAGLFDICQHIDLDTGSGNVNKLPEREVNYNY
jgi:2-dehydro-3-deoxygalactonokinase